jgi:hypothetical protein
VPFVTIGASHGGPQGGLLGMIVGAALFGVLAVFTAYWSIRRLKDKVAAEPVNGEL